MGRFFTVILLCFLLIVPVSAQVQKSVQTTHASASEPSDEIEITVAENRILINNAPIGSKLQIYSVVGVKVKEIEMKQSSGEYLLNIAKGYYIIRIGDTVRKIAIR